MALVPAAGTVGGDIVLGVLQHPVKEKTVLKPDLGPVYPLVPGCRNVMAQTEDFLPELPGDHQKPLLSPFPRLFPEDCDHPGKTGSG